VEADENVVIKEAKSDDRDFVELVWRERLPLGMNLLMNDESGLLKVVDFPRGSQARAVCEKRGLDPEEFKGATIIGVNGTEYDDQEDLFDALKDPARPKTVRFELTGSEDAERVRRFVEGDEKENSDDGMDVERVFALRDVVFKEPGELGIQFGTSLDNFGLVVQGFVEGEGGVVLAAQRSGKIHEGDLLMKVSGQAVVSTGGSGRQQAVNILENAASSRPLTLTFADPYLFAETVEKPAALPGRNEVDDGGPQELVLGEEQHDRARRVVISGFVNVSGRVESGGIYIGDHLVFINGLPVGAGCRWLGVEPSPSLNEVYDMVKTDSSYPMGLTFARPRQTEGRWPSSPGGGRDFRDDEADTMCITVDTPEQLGCVFEQLRNHDIVVGDFKAVPGAIQRAIGKYRKNKVHLAVDSLNGQFVPSYATKDMVRSAVSRSWKSDGRVEMWLSDDMQKHWLHAMAFEED